MPFATSFFYNPTRKSIKCNSTEEWADSWIDVSSQWGNINLPCSTNDAPVATFYWDRFQMKL